MIYIQPVRRQNEITSTGRIVSKDENLLTKEILYDPKVFITKKTT